MQKAKVAISSDTWQGWDSRVGLWRMEGAGMLEGNHIESGAYRGTGSWCIGRWFNVRLSVSRIKEGKGRLLSGAVSYAA